MNTHTGRKRPLRTVLSLLLLSILVEKFWIADLFPWLSGVAGVNPIVVFLDIPVPLPVVIGLIPVAGVFSLLYLVVLISFHRGQGWPIYRKRIWSALSGLSILLLCILTGGWAYYLVQDHLPRQVRNGIDSFGIHADLYTPYPDHELIHFRGGLFMLIGLLIGWRIFMKKVNRELLPPPHSAMDTEITGEYAETIPYPPLRKQAAR